MKKKNSLKYYSALISGLSFMSFAAILIKSANAPGIVTAFYRMGIGAAVLTIPFWVYTLKYKPIFTKRGIVLAILAGACFGFDLSLWATGVVMSNATLPTLFANLAPIWVGLGSMFIFKEKHSMFFWVGLTISIAGIIILVSQNVFEQASVITGILLGTGAGIFYGVFYLISQKGREQMNTLPFLYISTFSSALVLFIMMLIFSYPFTGYDEHTWTMFLLISIGVQVAGWFLINYSQGFLPATIVAPTLLGQPVITAFLATFFLHEYFTTIQLIGGVIVVLGIYLVHYHRKK